MPLRWVACVIGAATLALTEPPHPLPYVLLIAGSAVYCILLELLVRHYRGVQRIAWLFPVVDGVIAVIALLLVQGALNPFTPLFSLVLASIAIRLRTRASFVLGGILLGGLALGLHLHPDKTLEINYIFFTAFSGLIVALVSYLARNVRKYQMSADDLNSLLHHFPCGVIIKDGRGLYANAHLIKSLGLPEAETVDDAIELLAHDRRIHYLWNQVKKCTPAPGADGVSLHTEVTIDMDGITRTYACQRMKLTLASGAKTDVATLIDLTHDLQVRRRLQEQERLRLIGTLTTMAIHEVRNPLAAIRATAQLIGLQKDPSAVREQANRITQMVDQLHTFLERLMDLGRVPVERGTECNVSTLMHEVTALMTPMADRAGVTIVVDAPVDMTVAGDPHALRQVLINLVQNGIDAVPRGGSVTVSVQVEGDAVHLLVKDEGPGIPPDLMEQIFVPFYTTKEKGTGLGLAISKQIIEDHGGEIWCESGAGGTTFHIKLPIFNGAEVEREIS